MERSTCVCTAIAEGRVEIGAVKVLKTQFLCLSCRDNFPDKLYQNVPSPHTLQNILKPLRNQELQLKVVYLISC